MTTRGSFSEVLKPGGRMPKGKPYKAKKTKTEEKKGGKKEEMKKPPFKSGRRVSV